MGYYRNNRNYRPYRANYNTGGSAPGTGCTEPQHRFITTLVKQIEEKQDSAPADVLDKAGSLLSAITSLAALISDDQAVWSSVDRRETSQAIDVLKAVDTLLSVAVPGPSYPGLPPYKKVITAKFAKGGCYGCGAPIVVGTDLAVLSHGGTWQPWCLTCATETPEVRADRKERQAEEERREAEARNAEILAQREAQRTVNDKGAAVFGIVGTDLEKGKVVRFAVRGEHQDLDFYALKVGRWNVLTLMRVIGGHADTPVDAVKAAEVLGDLVFKGEKVVKHAVQVFGQKLGYCGVCGRHLTDEESRRFGIGPVCRGSW